MVMYVGSNETMFTNPFCGETACLIQFSFPDVRSIKGFSKNEMQLIVKPLGFRRYVDFLHLNDILFLP